MNILNKKEYFDYLKYGKIPDSEYVAETGVKLTDILADVTDGLDRIESWDILRIMRNICTWSQSNDVTEKLYEILDYCDHLRSYEDKNKDFFKYLRRRKSIVYMNADDIIHSFAFDVKGLNAWYTGQIISSVLKWRQNKNSKHILNIRKYTKCLINQIELLERENHGK